MDDRIEMASATNKVAHDAVDATRAPAAAINSTETDNEVAPVAAVEEIPQRDGGYSSLWFAYPGGYDEETGQWINGRSSASRKPTKEEIEREAAIYEAFSKEMDARRKAEKKRYREEHGHPIVENLNEYKKKTIRFILGTPAPAHKKALEEKKLPAWKTNPHLPRNQIVERPKKIPPINCEPEVDSMITVNLYYFTKSPIRAILPKKWLLVIIDLKDIFFRAHPNLNRTYAYERLDLEELIGMAIGGNRRVECLMEMHRRFMVKFYAGEWDSRDPVPRIFREQNIRENYLWFYDQDWKIQRDVDIFSARIGRGRGDGPKGVYRGPI